LKHYIALFDAPAVQISNIQKKSTKQNKLKKYIKKSKLAQILKLSLKQCIIAQKKTRLKKQKTQKIFAEGQAGPSA
jgi:alpha-galactosidase